jgi:pSer/pThr/pTyr-binding forkhead associated (FHA) protein
MLFDIHSQGGTLVNGVRVREHRLRSGDVIQVGRTHILYTQESYADDALAPTDSFEPLA